MARAFPEFTGTDLIRFWRDNLRVEEKRIVLIYFWGLNPDLQPKNDRTVVNLIFDIIGLIPLAGNIIRFLELTQNTINVILDLAELFEAITKEEELENELEKALEESLSLRDEISRLLGEIRRLARDLVDATEELGTLDRRIDFLQRELAECRRTLAEISQPIPPPVVTLPPSPLSQLQISWLQITRDLLNGMLRGTICDRVTPGGVNTVRFLLDTLGPRFGI